MSELHSTEEYRTESGSILTDYVQGDFKLSMWIPKDLGGKVIGKRGVVITNLQRESKVKQINALQPVGNSSWIAVVILGGYRNIVMAYNAISEIVEHEVDGVVLEFMINYKKPFFLYGGRKYAIIKRISADTNVRIFFPEFNPKEQPFSEAVPFSLEGECVDVQKAVDELEKEAVLYRQQQTLKFAARNIEYDPHSERPIRGREIRDTRDKEVRDSRDLPASRDAAAPKAPVAATATTTAAAAAPGAQKLFDLVNQNERANSGRQTAASSSSSAIATTAAPATAAPTRVVAQQQHPDDMDVVVNDERAERVKIEKTVEVPSTLVGLLLSKKPKAKVTILNQIQHLTHTVVSKIINPDTLADNQEESSAPAADSEAGAGTAAGSAAAVGPNSRRRRDGEEADSDDDSESEGGHSDDHEAGVEGKKAASGRPSSKKGATGKPVFINSDDVFVTFRIMGYTEESVDMVIDHLKRIIAGDRIKIVLEDLRDRAQTLRREVGAPRYKSTSAVAAAGTHEEQYEARKYNNNTGSSSSGVGGAGVVSGGYLAVTPEAAAAASASRLAGGAGRGSGRGRGSRGGAERDADAPDVRGEQRERPSGREDRPPREERGPRPPREERAPKEDRERTDETGAGGGSGSRGSSSRGGGRSSGGSSSRGGRGGSSRGGRSGPPAENSDA